MRQSIVYYHSVGGLPPQTLPTERFVAHLDAIRRVRIEVLTVSELADAPRERRAMALCFDDGLLDNVEVVLPLLVERGLRATFYVVPGHAGITRWVDARTGRWSDARIEGFDVAHPVSGPDQWRALARAGMEVGCHGWSHRPLTEVEPQELGRETRGARQAIQAAVDQPVRSFCYPLGRVGPRVVRAVREAGFDSACTTVPGPVGLAPNRWLLPRFLVEDLSTFEAVIRGQAGRSLLKMGWRAVAGSD